MSCTPENPERGEPRLGRIREAIQRARQPAPALDNPVHNQRLERSLLARIFDRVPFSRRKLPSVAATAAVAGAAVFELASCSNSELRVPPEYFNTEAREQRIKTFYPDGKKPYSGDEPDEPVPPDNRMSGFLRIPGATIRGDAFEVPWSEKGTLDIKFQPVVRDLKVDQVMVTSEKVLFATPPDPNNPNAWSVWDVDSQGVFSDGSWGTRIPMSNFTKGEQVPIGVDLYGTKPHSAKEKLVKESPGDGPFKIRFV